MAKLSRDRGERPQSRQVPFAAKRMNDKAERARFRALTRHENIMTAAELAAGRKLEFDFAPPLINDIVVDVQAFNARAARIKRVAKRLGFTGLVTFVWKRRTRTETSTRR